MIVNRVARCIAMAVVLFSAIAWLTAPVSAQWFGFSHSGGNWNSSFGGNSRWGNHGSGHSQFGHQSRRVPIQGNWFETHTTPGHLDKTENWVPGKTTIKPKWENIIPDVGAAILSGNQNHQQHHHHHRPPRPHHHHHHHFENRPQSHQPRPNVVYITEPAPPANSVPSTAPAPPVTKNKVVKKVTPQENDARFHGYGEIASAETDAQQVITASEMETLAQVGTEADVNTAIANIADPQTKESLKNAWDEYVNDPSVEKLKEFKETWGNVLDQHAGPGASQNLDLQIQIGEYKQNLLDGRLTGVGKDKAIAEIQESISKINNPDFQQAMQTKSDELQDLNNLGKLAEATQHDHGGLATLMQGAASAGYPPSFVGEMIGAPILDVPPVADESGKTVSSGAYLFNPEENEGPIHFTLGDEAHELEPGADHTCAARTAVRFDNGQGSTKKYTLSEASYKFRIIDDAWDLRRVTFKATIDNSGYPADFHYVLDNKRAVVKAGEVKTIESPYPIELIFDRGDDGEPAHKRLLAGNYKVGLDAGEKRIDLFDEQVIADGPIADSLVAESPRARAAAKRAQLVQEKLRAKTAQVSTSGNVDRLLQALKGN